MMEHYRGNEEFVKRMLDLCKQSLYQYTQLITPFLTPQEQMIARNVIGKQCYLIEDGGYPQAQSKRFLISPYECEDDVQIVCLKAQYHKMQKELSHRDVLGALMHIGIARDCFGDILVQEEDIYIFVKQELASFIQQELTQIARYSCIFKPFVGSVSHVQELVYKTKSVASMRLDCIVAVCANVSRTKAEALIREKCVKVDYMPIEECKCLCNNNSTISIRGFGRFVLRDEQRMSKKGKRIIEIGMYV